MALDRDAEYRAVAERGKYRRLYWHLRDLKALEWWTSFSEIESIVGFGLPDSARLHRPWWANQGRGGGHSHALAWMVPGWETASVDMEAGTLVFRRSGSATELKADVSRLDLDEMFPVHRTRLLRAEASFSREEMYEDRV